MLAVLFFGAGRIKIVRELSIISRNIEYLITNAPAIFFYSKIHGLKEK